MRNADNKNKSWRRRDFLSLGTALAAGGVVMTVTDRAAGAAATINMQLGWIGGGNQLGEVAALQLGYFDEEGLDLNIAARRPEQ